MRGAGEADEAIKACTRGHDGSLATGHFNSVEEAIEGTGLMLIEEGKNLPLNLAKLQVARAFNVIVQMYTSTVHGVKKITHIAEIWPDGDKVVVRDLVVWRPQPDDFLKGEWMVMNPPSERLVKKMRQYGVTSADFREAGVVL
jgi:pilus assembly protein CpaF